MSNSNFRPILGITMGDPGGIGPEIACKALDDPEIYKICRPLVIGDAEVMDNALKFCGLASLKTNVVHNPKLGKYEHGVIDVYDLANLPLPELKHKTVTPAQGKASYEYVAKAIELAMAKDIDGTVTGPINKAAINSAGFHYAGHTEIYADHTKTKDYTMMLADENFRVAHVTTHVSLRDACERVKKARVLRVIELCQEGLKHMGLEHPRIAVAGLNPHAGEDGLFGKEEQTVIAPAVEQARLDGLQVDGPIPPDTVFFKAASGLYDAWSACTTTRD